MLPIVHTKLAQNRISEKLVNYMGYNYVKFYVKLVHNNLTHNFHSSILQFSLGHVRSYMYNV